MLTMLPPPCSHISVYTGIEAGARHPFTEWNPITSPGKY
jgi:hypothetical protein